MTRGAAVIAVGAVSALGIGTDAYRAGAPGDRPRCAIAEDEALAAAGLTRPRLARAAAAPTAGDHATDLLVAALAQLTGELDRVLPRWRSRRLGVCIGTSSGGMLSAERFFAARFEGAPIDAAAARAASYFAPFEDALARFDLTGAHKRLQVLAACASSTIALGLGLRWLERGACELVLAGGYDAVGLFVASGFESLRATGTTLPRPFRTGRDGMALGEGAALVALVPANAAHEPRFFVTGFGASCDAVHITAPDRSGAGLARAAQAALDDAGCPGARVGLVSAHATATPYNDAMEAKAIAAACPGHPVVHPFKAQIGHTLGAAGVLEALAAADALARGVAPAAAGEGAIDPEATVTLLARDEARPLEAALKLSAAFGGVTAALTLEKAPPPVRHARAARRVALRASAHVEAIDRAAITRATGLAADRLARLDELGLYALGAVALLAETVGRERLAGAGIVGGYALATLDTNERFYARLLQKGARWVDPRLFPATSPNAGAGHCAIAFGLTGPSFATSSGAGGALEALAAAAELVAAGDADRMVVVSADDAGHAARAWLELVAPGREQRAGAVAVLIEAGQGDRAVDPDLAIDHESGPFGHLALLEWLG